MENSTFKQLSDAVSKANVIGIAISKEPNLDEMAAALSLYLALLESGKNVSIASPTNPKVEVATLVGVDKVKTDFEGKDGDLVVSFPYNEGEVEKVSYTLDDGFLNIVVKPGEKGLAFQESDVQFRRSGGNLDLMFVIGSRKVSDLGHLFDPEKLKDSKIVNIDNKADNQGFGDIIMVSTKLSSISEQVGNMIMALGLKVDEDIAQNLMSGISFATNNFQSPTTSSLAFEIAGALLRQGATRVKPGSNRTEIQERVAKAFPGKLEERKEEGEITPPDDWLAPKIYKGSSEF